MRPSAAIGTSSRVTPYEVFVLCLSIWAIVSLAAESTFALSPATTTILEFSDNVLCAIFFADFLHSLWVSPDRWKYMRSWGWIDLLSSVPAVDALRIGRIGRLVRILRVVRTIRSARLIIRYIIQRKRESAVLAGVLLTLLFLMVSSIVILQFEVPAGGNIKTAHDAMWWSVSTMATMAYGDVYPITPEGRFIAIVLMVSGISVFGTVAGLIATWFLAGEIEAETSELDDIRESCKRIEAHLNVEERSRT